MTQLTSTDAFNVSVCPVDGSMGQITDMQDTHEAAVSARHTEWTNAFKYAADMNLAMAGLSQLATQYFANKSLEASLDAASKSFNIADRQMNIAEEEYARYKLHFFCNEHALAAEACEAFEENPDYENAEARAARSVQMSLRPQLEAMKRARKRYCMCDNLKDMCDLSKEAMKLTLAARNASYQIEDARAAARKDAYNNFRLEISKLGRGIQTDQLTTYQNAMPAAIDAINMAANARVTRNSIWAGGINNILGAYFSPRIAAPAVYNGTYANATMAGSGGSFGQSFANSQIANVPPARPFDLVGV